MGAIYLLPFLAALGASIAGAARAGREWPDWPALLTILGLTAVLAAFVWTWRDDEIQTATVVLGGAFGSLLMATIPLLLYYAMGRALARRRLVLALAWLASVVPLGCWLFLTLLMTADIVSCPPDAYECPL
jgi:hypothetical protein